MRRHAFAEGDLIFANGDDATELFMILSGDVEIRRDGFTAVMGRGEIFGEAALLDETRSMSASAKSDCVILGLTRDEIIESFTKDPNAALEIIEAVFRKLANTTDELIRLKAGITT